MQGAALNLASDPVLRDMLQEAFKWLWRSRGLLTTYGTHILKSRSWSESGKSKLQKKGLTVAQGDWLFIFSKDDFDGAWSPHEPKPSFRKSDDASYRKFDPLKSGDPILLKYKQGAQKGRCLALRINLNWKGHKCKVKLWEDIAQIGPYQKTLDLKTSALSFKAYADTIDKI